jgi:hypothetical protein
MAREYDFYSPFFSAAIITHNNVRVPLWTNSSDGIKNAAAEEFSKEDNAAVSNGLVSFPFLESVTVEMGLGYFPRITAVLTPPFQDVRRFLDSTLVENGKAMLEVIVGYSAGTSGGPVLSAPFQALILEPDISIGMNSTITLNGFGVAGYDASVTQASRSFSNQSRKAILQYLVGGGVDVSDPEVAPESPFEPEAPVSIRGGILGSVSEFNSELKEEVRVNEKPKPRTVRRDLHLDFSAIEKGSNADLALERKITTAQGWKTDWMFMLQLANEAGCWLTMGVHKGGKDDAGKNSVQVVPIETHLAEAPKYNLRLFDFVQGKLGPAHRTNNGTPWQDRAEGDFPILSVSTQSKQVWLPGSTKALVANGIDSRTGKSVNHVWTPENASPGAVTGGGGALPEPDGRISGVSPEGKGGAPAPGTDVSESTTVETAKSRFVTDFSMGIALRVLTLGIPDIFPGNTVAVRGVGSRFDFNYGVFTVRHSLGPTGFTTELELVSNTSALLSSVSKAKADINNKLGVTASKEVVAEVVEDHGGTLGRVSDLNPEGF